MPFPVPAFLNGAFMIDAKDFQEDKVTRESWPLEQLQAKHLMGG